MTLNQAMATAPYLARKYGDKRYVVRNDKLRDREDWTPFHVCLEQDLETFHKGAHIVEYFDETQESM